MNQTATKNNLPIHKTQCGGFTLVELIVTLVILGILTAIAIPSFRNFTRSSEATSAANDLVSAMNLARSEAVTRAQRVSICKSANQTSCVTTGEWDQGWIVYVGETIIDELLRTNAAPAGLVTMSGGPNIMTYAPSGFFSGVSNGTIAVVSDTSQINVIFSSTGRVRSEKL